MAYVERHHGETLASVFEKIEPTELPEAAGEEQEKQGESRCTVIPISISRERGSVCERLTLPSRQRPELWRPDTFRRLRSKRVRRGMVREVATTPQDGRKWATPYIRHAARCWQFTRGSTWTREANERKVTEQTATCIAVGRKQKQKTTILIWQSK